VKSFLGFGNTTSSVHINGVKEIGLVVSIRTSTFQDHKTYMTVVKLSADVRQ
jgi:hypothetical protein